MKKDILFNFGTQDLERTNRNFLFVSGKDKVMQEIAFEVTTFKGSLFEDPSYGSQIAGALNSTGITENFKLDEIRRVALKHPAVEYIEDLRLEEGKVTLVVKIFDSWGGGSASTNFQEQ